MNNPTFSRLFEGRRIGAPRIMRGVVLPIVLVVLTVLTGLVVTQIRRGVIEERMALNNLESVQMDNASQTVLRWCEARLTARPLDTVRVLPNAPTVAPVWDAASAAWGTAGQRLIFNVPGALPGIDGNPACVIEDATCELSPSISETGQNHGGCRGIDSRWRKFRITARVTVPAPDLVAGSRQMFSQSELRLWLW